MDVLVKGHTFKVPSCETLQKISPNIFQNIFIYLLICLSKIHDDVNLIYFLKIIYMKQKNENLIKTYNL